MSMEMSSYCAGWISSRAQYKDYTLSVWAPNDCTDDLETLRVTIGGSWRKETGKRAKWIIEDSALDQLVTLFYEELPNGEGRNRFLKWAESKYELRRRTSRVLDSMGVIIPSKRIQQR